MKTLILLAHPDIALSVINKSWIEILPKENKDITVHNIYVAYPDWKIDVKAEQALLESHDRIIFQYPIYWYNMPPLMKKWFDEVYAYGWCYGPGGDKLEGKEIGLAISTGGIAEAYAESDKNAITSKGLTQTIVATANYTHSKFESAYIFHGALGNPSEETLKEAAMNYVSYVTK